MSPPQGSTNSPKGERTSTAEPGGDRADNAMCTALAIEGTVTAQKIEGAGFTELEELRGDMASPKGHQAIRSSGQCCSAAQLAAWGRRLGMAPGAMEAWAHVTTRPLAMAACYGVATMVLLVGTIFVHLVSTPLGLRVQIPAAAHTAVIFALSFLYWRSGPRHHKPKEITVMNLFFVMGAVYLWLPVCAAAVMHRCDHVHCHRPR
jgi:hypothetical protein